jgi:hypothetical protein
MTATTIKDYDDDDGRYDEDRRERGRTASPIVL